MKLITGGSGFLGVELAGQLTGRGDEVRVFDIAKSAGLPAGVEYIKGDVRDCEAVSRACDGVDTAYHLVGIMPQARMDSDGMRKINVGGTRNVLRGCVENKVPRMVFLSTSEVYGLLEKVPCPEAALKAPIGEYGNNKVASELICQEFIRDFGLGVSILRPTSIVGPDNWEKSVNRLMGQIKKGGVMPMPGRGRNHWQVAHVVDVAQAAILAGEKEEAIGEAFNVGGADEVPSQRELAEVLSELAGSQVKFIDISARFAVGILKFLHLFGLSPMEMDHLVLLEHDFVLDVTKLQEKLGWKPKFGNLDAFKDMYLWYESTH